MYRSIIAIFCLFLGSAYSFSCTADYEVFTQPPNWPTGLNAQLSVNVDDPSQLLVNGDPGWTLSFTAKGFGATEAFDITSFWNAASRYSDVLQDQNTTTRYTFRNAAYNAQTPQYFGFIGSTSHQGPRNDICGVSINGVSCALENPTPLPPVPSGVVDLAYEVIGCGPLIILIHGITEQRRMWDPLLPLLTPHFRIINVDLRGHGQSPLGDTYANQFPVRGVINIDQVLDLASFQAQLLPVQPLLEDPTTFPFVIAGLFAGLYGNLPQSTVDDLNAKRNPVQSVVLGVWAQIFTLTLDQLNEVVFETATIPGGTPYLAIHGQVATPPTYPAWLAQLNPTSQVEFWTEGNTHYPHLYVCCLTNHAIFIAGSELGVAPQTRCAGNLILCPMSCLGAAFGSNCFA